MEHGDLRRDFILHDGLKIIGGYQLKGTAPVGGSKNAALALLAGALLVDDEFTLHNMPIISDTLLMIKCLEHVGAQCWLEGNSLTVNATNLERNDLPETIARKIRASFSMLGPLLARMKSAVVPPPGGCPIGTRPVNYHIKGLEQLGAKIELHQGVYTAKAGILEGANIYLDTPSPGATQHLMTAACLAEGFSVINNAAIEPEVVDLAFFLNKMGAKIEGAGTPQITIQGVRRLHGGEYTLISDRIQAGGYMLCAAMTKGDITVAGIVPEHLQPLVSKLREAEIDVQEGHDWIRVRSSKRPKATDIKTMPFPGFPTDMQQPMCSLLAIADGTSVVNETIYENRNNHIFELQRMGAKIKAPDSRTFMIEGVDSLKGAVVEGHDLRGGAAMILAALAAEGETIVTGMNHVDRGYENLDAVLTALGAKIERIQAPVEEISSDTSSA